MSFPAAIWPYLMAMAGALCLLSWVTGQAAAARSLACILAAYVAIRLVSSVYGDQGIYMALGALIWSTAAIAVTRLSGATCGSIIAASTLCYYWAAYVGAPRVVGSPPYVASDVLMVIAMLWIGANGILALSGRALDLAGSFGGPSDSRSGGSASLSS